MHESRYCPLYRPRHKPLRLLDALQGFVLFPQHPRHFAQLFPRSTFVAAHSGLCLTLFGFRPG
jgi:hypothetical protein